MTKQSEINPKVFISYSWENDNHRVWIENFSTRLRRDGVDVMLDQWHAAPGDQLPAFMERAIQENDFVLIICTPAYRQKSDARKGGVGYEGDIITAEVLVKGNHRKFIPILRIGEWQDAAPAWLLGKYYLDFRGETYSNSVYESLLDILFGTRAGLPVLGMPRSKALNTEKRLNLLRDLSANDQINIDDPNRQNTKDK